MSRAIPSTVPVCGKEWRVRSVSRRALGGNHGDCNPNTRTIRVRSDESVDDQFQHYLHELIHAVIFEAFHQSAIVVDLGPYEEPIVLALETGLYPALKESGFGQ